MNFKYMKDFLDRLTDWRIPGASVSVYKDNKEIFNYSSGYADLENKIPMSGDKMLNLYSCSKPATVTGALRLYEQGYFLLDDPLYDFLPEYKEMYVKNSDGTVTPAKTPITMRHLFTMTAGLTYNRATDGFKRAIEISNGNPDAKTIAKCIASDPLSFEPGSLWQYSLCHDVLAAVCEVITGKRFSEYMIENVFAPLGMNNTFYHNEGVRDKMAEQYRFKTDEDKSIVNMQAFGDSREGGVLENVGKARAHSFPNFDSGGSGVVSSVNEYAKFASCLANGGLAPNGERILSDGTVLLMCENQLGSEQIKGLKWSQLKGYGYGLGVRTMIDKAKSGSPGPVGEFGWGGAAGATLLCDYDNKLSMFYSHHMLNPQEPYYQPRLRNVLYSCIN